MWPDDVYIVISADDDYAIGIQSFETAVIDDYPEDFPRVCAECDHEIKGDRIVKECLDKPGWSYYNCKECDEWEKKEENQ